MTISAPFRGSLAVLLSLGLLGASVKKPEARSTRMPLTTAQAKSFHAICVKGKAHSDSKNFRAAAEEFKKALLIWPDHPDTYTNLGNVLFYGKNVKQAWDCYGMSLKLEPDQAPMRAWLTEKKALLRTFTAEDGAAFLKWEASPSAKGYLVYRKRGPGLPDLRLTESPLLKPEFVARGMVPGERGVFSLTQLVLDEGRTVEKPLGEVLGCAVLVSLYEAPAK